MAWTIKEGKNFYGGENQPKNFSTAGVGNQQFPVSGGRVSRPDQIATFAPSTKLQEIPLDFSVEYLVSLENLAAYNEDISYAVDNIVQLANTEHEISFPDNIPDKQAALMRAHLLAVQDSWYENSSGMQSLKGDLLTQVVVNGALSAEHYPKQDLSGIDQIVRIAPKNIRFQYDKAMGRYMPYQCNVNGVMFSTNMSMGMLRLNTATYKYIAIRRFFQSPYATPPFITAIESVVTQKDMIRSFKNIMQKLGMLGFLSAEVSPPNPIQGESPDEYWARCSSYLDNYVYPQIQKNLSTGVVAGFSGQHKFTLNGNNMNTQGAADLFKIVQSRLFAGVKQDPNMLGENYSVTETFGRVILAKMLSQVEDYQTVVDKFIAGAYLLELRLAGFKIDSIEVKSKLPLVTDQAKAEAAETSKISNVKTKRDMGIISQTQAANELGYEKPDSEGDIAPVGGDPANPTPDPTAGDNKTDPSNDPKASDSNLKIRQIEYRLARYKRGYDYQEWHKCSGVTKDNFYKFDNEFAGTDLGKYTQSYFTEMFAKYQAATKKIADGLANKLHAFASNTPEDTVQREAYLYLISRWETDFVQPMSEVIQNNITAAWEHFRKDKTIFDGKNPKGYAKSKFSDKDIPNGVLDLDDFRAIQYMESSDTMYLGKFITDKDTKAKVQKYIQKNYLEGYLPIGQNEDAMKQFKKEFADTLDLEAWKIRRIIDTTMNKVRNYSHVYYMQQALVDKFEVIEMNDNLTCDYCASMNGKIFDVSNAVSKIKKETNSTPDSIGSTSPFLTTQSIEDVQSKSAEELQGMGFDSPPYHPHCRGTIGAVLD